MLVRLIKYLKGYVKIKVEGYSPERFFNLCNVHGILLWGVDNKEFFYEMYVGVKDYKRMRPLVQKTRTKIILLEKHGLPFFLHRFRKRKMFFAGMFLCIAFIYTLSLFVWNIHFEGNATQSTEELVEYLGDLGVTHGTLKSKIICEEIETKLRTRYPNILWVSAEMRGTRIIVQIKENTDKDIISAVEVKDKEPASIVADCGGIIESVVVRHGTSLVKAGDEVVKGQTLVEGYYEIKNDAGEIVRYEGVAADADIVILATEDYKDSFSMKYEAKQYTEKKRMGILLTIFDKNYVFTPKIPYKIYDTITKHYEIHVTENFYLPFSTDIIWYLEYDSSIELYTEQEVKELAQTRFLNKYKNILQKGVQIIEKDVKIDTNGKLCLVTGTVRLSVPVTTRVPAVIPETVNNASLEGEN